MRTIAEIYQSLCADFAARSGVTPAEGGDMALRLHAVAAELFTLEAQAVFVARQSFPQTALGEFLDRHAELRGLTRGVAARASGTLRFYVNEAAAAPVAVPAGTVCMTAAGVSFVTTADAEIAAGDLSCDAPAEASDPGSGGNAAAGTVTFLRLPPTGVAGVVNPEPFAGGDDGEDDDSLRARVLTAYRTLPNGANAAWYERKVLSAGAAAVTVLPRVRGVGTVDVVFAMAGGVPTAAQVAEVQSLLDGEREICVDLAVRAPATVAVDVAAALTVAADRDFDAVAAAARAALEAWFSGERLSRPVYRAALSTLLMGVEGVENCALSLPAADLAAADGVLPVLGALTLSPAE